MKRMANGNLYVWVNDDLLKHNAANALSRSVTDETDAKGMYDDTGVTVYYVSKFCVYQYVRNREHERKIS